MRLGRKDQWTCCSIHACKCACHCSHALHQLHHDHAAFAWADEYGVNLPSFPVDQALRGEVGYGARHRRPRPGGDGRRQQGAGPAVAAVAPAQAETRICHHCQKKGHLKPESPQLNPDVRKYLLEEYKKRPNKKKPDVFIIEFNRSYPVCASEPHAIIIDSGAHISVVRNIYLLAHVDPCEICASPAGAGELPIIGKGIMHVKLGHCVDVGNVHNFDSELADV